MSRPQPAFAETAAPEAGQHYARLRHVLALVEQIAGRDSEAGDRLVDEAARVGVAYAGASPVAQRRFDTIIAEISTWASAGVDTLAEDPASKPRAAAARLADELADSLQTLARLLRL